MIVIICNQNGHVIAFDIFLVIICFIIIQSSSKILTRRDNLFLLYLINLIKNSPLCDQNSHFFDPRYKGQLISKKIVRPRILQKNERMNWFLLVCDVFSFGFLKNPRPEKNVSRLSDLYTVTFFFI